MPTTNTTAGMASINKGETDIRNNGNEIGDQQARATKSVHQTSTTKKSIVTIDDTTNILKNLRRMDLIINETLSTRKIDRKTLEKCAVYLDELKQDFDGLEAASAARDEVMVGLHQEMESLQQEIYRLNEVKEWYSKENERLRNENESQSNQIFSLFETNRSLGGHILEAFKNGFSSKQAPLLTNLDDITAVMRTTKEQLSMFLADCQHEDEKLEGQRKELLARIEQSTRKRSQDCISDGTLAQHTKKK